MRYFDAHCSHSLFDPIGADKTITKTSDRTADGRFGPQASSGECDNDKDFRSGPQCEDGNNLVMSFLWRMSLPQNISRNYYLVYPPSESTFKFCYMCKRKTYARPIGRRGSCMVNTCESHCPWLWWEVFEPSPASATDDEWTIVLQDPARTQKREQQKQNYEQQKQNYELEKQSIVQRLPQNLPQL